MAVDTREKRFSFLNFGEGAHFHTTFEADGTVDLDDRQHLLDCYSGIAFDAPVLNDIYISFPPFITTDVVVVQLTVESFGGTITDTTILQKPIDFIMADNPPVMPVLSDRPSGRLRGPKLVNRIHIET